MYFYSGMKETQQSEEKKARETETERERERERNLSHLLSEGK